jgi:hypothetical protein
MINGRASIIDHWTLIIGHWILAAMIGRASQLSIGFFVVVLHAGVAVAQAPRAQPAFPSFHAIFEQPSTTLYTLPDEASKHTYWLEGGVIGAVVLGVTAYFVEDAVANSLCSDTDGGGCHDYRTVAIVGGAALGFLVGSLIGKGHTKAAS